MIKSYLTIAWRNLSRKQVYSFINIFGLAVACAFCTLITLYILDELSFDQEQQNKERLYRVLEKRHFYKSVDQNGPFSYSTFIQGGVRNALLEDYPKVEYATRYRWSEGIIREGDKTKKFDITFVDPDFLQMFSFPLVHGARSSCLDRLDQIVLTQKISNFFFGSENPVGRFIELNFSGELKSYQVSGVIDNAPSNSSFDYGALVNIMNRPRMEEHESSWQASAYPTFIQVIEPMKKDELDSAVHGVLRMYAQENIEAFREYEQIPEGEPAKVFEVEPLSELHFSEKAFWTRTSKVKYSYVLGGVALLIMFLASLNYIIISITQGNSRSKEIGVRKVNGASFSSLVAQFALESALTGVVASLLGFLLAVVSIDTFNDFTSKNLNPQGIEWGVILGLSVSFGIFIGVAAGIYPSVYLPRKKGILRGDRASSKINLRFSRPLVVVQFCMSSFLIISSVVMFRQIDFLLTKSLGFDKENVIVLDPNTGYDEQANQIKERLTNILSANTSIQSVSGTSTAYGDGWSKYSFKHEGEDYQTFVYRTDENFFDVMGLDLVEGRNFTDSEWDKNNAVIVNQAMVQQLGVEDPINMPLNVLRDSIPVEIIGVVEDHFFQSLEHDIGPMLFHINSEFDHINKILVKSASGSTPQALKVLEEAWKTAAPEKPFEFTFLDDLIDKRYSQYEKWSSIIGTAAAFAILIAALGLFGLSGVLATNRMKEVGIRKVLGANLRQLILLLNKEFVWMSVIAFALAVPAGWYAMNKWLENFEFAISLTPQLFLLTFAGILLISLLVVSYHTIQTAFINPSTTLKDE